MKTPPCIRCKYFLVCEDGNGAYLACQFGRQLKPLKESRELCQGHLWSVRHGPLQTFIGSIE